MPSSQSNSGIVLELAEEYLERHRKGERPSIKEYIDRFPDLAAEIRDVFPAMAMMENIAVIDDTLSESAETEPAGPVVPSVEQLGDFRIIREIGRGGMGVVYEAEQVSLGRHVALKVLPNQALNDVRQKRRFEREARAAARLHHTNIVPVFGVGEHEGSPYYVMQYIQGLGLDAVLNELNRSKPGGSAPRPAPELTYTRGSSLGPAGERGPAGTAFAAAQMAHSLMTGAFPNESVSSERQPTEGLPMDSPGTPTCDEGTVESDGQDQVLWGRLPAADAGRSGQNSDLLSLSGSSLSLPGTTHVSGGRKSSSRKRTYWYSVATIGRQVADALDYAHKQGILHRDVKPSNLLLDLRGTVWVTDFGLAKVAGPGAENLTHTGDILGTLRYMPPEAFEGKSDARSDVYSLGLTLYEMLARRPAFDQKDRNRLIKQVTSEEPTPLDRVSREIPRDLVTIVQRAIAREPAHRYATADELAADLQRFLDDEPILARRQTPLERCIRWARHNPGIAGMLAVLIGVLVVASVASVIVAGRMARTAANERLARRQAEESQVREAELRERAEAAGQAARAAERSARDAEEAGRKLLYTTDMRLAPFLWRDDQTTANQLRTLLDRHIPEQPVAGGAGARPVTEKPDLRGFEWYYYQHLLDEGATVLSGHAVPVEAGAFAPDGALVTLDQNGQLRRWDPESRLEVEAARRDLVGARGAQIRALSSHGRLAAVTDDKHVRVFDTVTGREKYAIESPFVPYRQVSFSGDGTVLVVLDRALRWFQAETGSAIASFDHHFTRAQELPLSNDGMTVAVAGHGNVGDQVAVLRVNRAARTASQLGNDWKSKPGTLRAAAMSPAGDQLAMGSFFNGGLSVGDTATGRTISTNGSAHASPITAMAFSRDGRKLATGDAEGTIKIWTDAPALGSATAARMMFKGHRGAIRSLAFAADGRQLLTTSVDRTARLWDLERTGAAVWSLEDAPAGFSLPCYSPDGLWIAGCSDRIRIWDAATGRLARALPVTGTVPLDLVAFSPADPRLLAVADSRSAGELSVSLWDIDAGSQVARMQPVNLPRVGSDRDASASSLAFSPDGKYLAAGAGSRFFLWPGDVPTPVFVWEIASRRLIRRLSGHTKFYVCLAFSKDGRLLASGSRDGTAIIWSTATWKPVRTIRNLGQGDTHSKAGAVEGLAFAPDGRTLAVAGRNHAVTLWDVATGKLLATLEGHSDVVNAVAFAPDGRTLASSAGDKTIRLWNVENRRELMRLDPGGPNPSHALALEFSPDGKNLLADKGFWSAAPDVWNDPAEAAGLLRRLLDSNADFASRIRMLSEHLRLHEALARLDARDQRVQAALAATQANWHAARKDWAGAVAAVDRLVTADPAAPERWLRTPGLLRVAAALAHENRPALAAALLRGGGTRREQDGIPPLEKRLWTGIRWLASDAIRVIEITPGGPASRTALAVGDVILKLNDHEIKEKNVLRFTELLQQESGATIRLTVRRAGRTEPLAIEVTRDPVMDLATSEQLRGLRAAIEAGLAGNPRDPSWLELHAELAGQWSDAAAQAADYTAAIAELSQRQSPPAADLQRLHGRRALAYVRMEKWQEAVDDFAHAITEQTTDDELLSNQALALARTLEPPDRSVRLGRENDSKGIALADNPDGLTEAALVERQECRSVRGDRNGWHDAYFAIDRGDKKAPTRDVVVEVEYYADTQALLMIEYDGANDPHTQSAQKLSLSGRLEWRSARFLLKEPRFAGSQKAEADFRVRANTLGRFFLKRVSVFESQPGTESDDPWVRLAAAYRRKKEERAIDALVARRPQTAEAIGDLYAAGDDWRRAIVMYGRALATKATDADLLAKRARAHEALGDGDAAAADLSRAATLDPAKIGLLVEFLRRLEFAGQRSKAKDQYRKARVLYEKALEADSENDVIAEGLARLLREEHEARPWTVLEPIEMKSSGGATMTRLEDGSILAGGANPDDDRYRVVLRVPADLSLAAIRIEALTHPSLPGNGPGRYPGRGPRSDYSGNFSLQRWAVLARRPDRSEILRVELDQAYADRPSQFPITSKGYWNIAGFSEGKDNAAIWTTRHPVPLPAGTTLTIEMEFSGQGPENLGRFRLSATGDRAAIDGFRQAAAARRLTDVWAQLGAAYALEGSVADAIRYFARAIERASGDAATKQIIDVAALSDDVLAGLNDRLGDNPRVQAALLRELVKRGQRLLTDNQSAKARTELEQARALYQRLMSAGDRWTTPVPIELTAESGRRLEINRDRSIFAANEPSRLYDTYALVFSSDLHDIKGLRVEALADFRLPQGGPGWDLYGNFALTELSLSATSPRNPDSVRAIPLLSPVADHSQELREIGKAVDGNVYTGWSVSPELGKDHTAIFDVASDLSDEKVLKWTVLIRQGVAQNDGHYLGRFRVSITDDPKALQAARIRLELKDSELADLHRALARAYALQGLTDQAAASFADALPFAVDRAATAALIVEAAAHGGVLEKLAQRAAADTRFQTELARYYAGRGESARAVATRDQSRTLLESGLAGDPDNVLLSDDLAEILLLDTPRWTVLEPAAMKSEGGATLTLRPDGSILASGRNPDRDVYSLAARPGLDHIRGIRLEALPDASLPGGGPGRSPDQGYFHLNEFRAFAGARPCTLQGILVAYDERYEASRVIDGKIDESTGWSNYPRSAQANAAVIATDVRLAPGEDFRIELYFSRTQYTQHNLGCFRLSVTDDAAALDRERLRLAASRVRYAWAKLALAYEYIGDRKARDSILAKHESEPALFDQLGEAYLRAGRTRDSVPLLVKSSAADPRDTFSTLIVAELQAWFGQTQDLAATRQRVLAFAHGTDDARIARHAALICSFQASADASELSAALELGRAAEQLSHHAWNLMARGMTEYRSGDYEAAQRSLLDAVQAGAADEHVTATSLFFRAMCLFRQGKRDEARKAAEDAVSRMKPWPADENNPFAGGATDDDLMVWLAYREASTLMKLDTAPSTRAPSNKK